MKCGYENWFRADCHVPDISPTAHSSLFDASHPMAIVTSQLSITGDAHFVQDWWHIIYGTLFCIALLHDDVIARKRILHYWYGLLLGEPTTHPYDSLHKGSAIYSVESEQAVEQTTELSVIWRSFRPRDVAVMANQFSSFRACLMQDCSMSIANTLEIQQSCTKPPIYLSSLYWAEYMDSLSDVPGNVRSITYL